VELAADVQRPARKLECSDRAVDRDGEARVGVPVRIEVREVPPRERPDPPEVAADVPAAASVRDHGKDALATDPIGACHHRAGVGAQQGPGAAGVRRGRRGRRHREGHRGEQDELQSGR
jgi:hypothetical protein